MGKVAVKDHGIWTKHIHGDEALRRQLEKLGPNETILLQVDGREGLWRKMGVYKTTGYPTPGLTPLGPAQGHWRSLFKERKGALVEIEVVGNDGGRIDPAPAVRWEEASEQERESAWAAFKALWSAGWRSEGPSLSRDELHERNPK